VEGGEGLEGSEGESDVVWGAVGEGEGEEVAEGLGGVAEGGVVLALAGVLGGWDVEGLKGSQLLGSSVEGEEEDGDDVVGEEVGERVGEREIVLLLLLVAAVERKRRRRRRRIRVKWNSDVVAAILLVLCKFS
jgi:hypothetical protein